MSNKVNFDKLMNLNPTKYFSGVNSLGQKVELVEHPIKGDESPVIVVFPEVKKAFHSEFWDTYDMEEGIENKSDYEPLYHNDMLLMGYEYY